MTVFNEQKVVNFHDDYIFISSFIQTAFSMLLTLKKISKWQYTIDC